LIGAVSAVAAAAVAIRELPLVLRRRYRRTPYDDLLSKLTDRDSSVAFGRAANKTTPGSASAIAALLRQRLRHGSLQAVVARELSQGHVFVAGGWVVSESLALICALAARES
jgi:hypothetical protein